MSGIRITTVLHFFVQNGIALNTGVLPVSVQRFLHQTFFQVKLNLLQIIGCVLINRVSIGEKPVVGIHPLELGHGLIHFGRVSKLLRSDKIFNNFKVYFTEH